MDEQTPESEAFRRGFAAGWLAAIGAAAGVLASDLADPETALQLCHNYINTWAAAVGADVELGQDGVLH